jgi:Asp-tRNA(Asn)/Glu-tRNA(Gln) amidotransferase A subunit family amidase
MALKHYPTVAILALLISPLPSCVSIKESAGARRLDYAFVHYWPQPEGSTALRLAVKDNIDLQGVVTTAGSKYLAKNGQPALRDAPLMRLARGRNVDVIGKTNMTEFAVTVSGKIGYFGTPRNRWDGKHEFIPGGSSSGSAVAVATDRADVAFGTDTGGSIRVPAACCGIFGLKTTFGLIPTAGVFPISPKHLDTVGPLAKDIGHLVQGMDLLEQGFATKYDAAVRNKPRASQLTIGRLYLNGTAPAIDQAIDDAIAARGFTIVRLDKSFVAKWAQADHDGKTVALADAWVNDAKYLKEKGISPVTKLVIDQGELEYKFGYKDALKRKSEWKRELRRVFAEVDFIAVATLQNLPPRAPRRKSSVAFEWLVFNSQNTVGVNFAGNPALAIPIAMPERDHFIPYTSLQLIGRPFSEAQLLNAGRLLEGHP